MDNYVFQTDSQAVKVAYTTFDNYYIDIDNTQSKKYCALYFSSNNIYFPNQQDVFENAIVNKNRFEWYGTRIKKAHKHIFLRDIKKQWYLTGINSNIDNPISFIEFLKKETKGYKVITIGSSAGGYAAVLYGQLLNAETIYSFNGQFEINSLLERSTEKIDPILFRECDNKDLRPYYDIKDFIVNPKTIHYFCSKNSSWDIGQYNHISAVPMNIYHFNTSHHGIPFIKSILPVLINNPIDGYKKYEGRKLNPILFSVRVGGLELTLKGLWVIAQNLFWKKLKF